MKITADLKFFTREIKYVELGTIPRLTFFYFPRKSFEILDEEILHLASKDPSHAFLTDPEEDVYSLEDGEPV